MENPCTEEALKEEQFYHEFPPDSHFFVQCDESGFPHIRPCPPSLVWSAAELTCVRSTQPTRMSAKTDKWSSMVAGSSQQQQQQQQNQGNMQQQNGAGGRWQPSGARKTWTFAVGGPPSAMQHWMVSYCVGLGFVRLLHYALSLAAQCIAIGPVCVFATAGRCVFVGVCVFVFVGLLPR